MADTNPSQDQQSTTAGDNEHRKKVRSRTRKRKGKSRKWVTRWVKK